MIEYFATAVVSPLEQPGQILLGSNGGCRVWFNGRQVLDQPTERGTRYADDVIDVPLKAGPNVLLVKLRNRIGASGLIVAVAGQRQKPSCSLDLPSTPPGAAVAQTNIAAGAVDTAGPAAKDGSALPPIDELAKL